MAELFVNPLVPQPIVVKSIAVTTNPSAGFVLTSDADGNGTWQATESSGANITISNADPHLLIANNAVNANGAVMALKAQPSIGEVDFKQVSTGGLAITNTAAAGPVSITTGAAGDLSLTSTAGEVKLSGTRVLVNGVDVVVSDEAKVTQLTSVTTGVVSNSYSVAITMFTPSVCATGSTVEFVLTNSRILADSILLCNIIFWNGSNGLPSVYVTSHAVGSCVISLQNNSESGLATDGTIKIGLLVL